MRTQGILGLIGARTTTVGLIYGPIGSLISTLLNTVKHTVNSTVNNTLVSSLNGLLTPLARLLGLTAGGADVYSGYRPTCDGARLVG